MNRIIIFVGGKCEINLVLDTTYILNDVGTVRILYRPTPYVQSCSTIRQFTYCLTIPKKWRKYVHCRRKDMLE